MPIDPLVAESVSVGSTADRFKALESFVSSLKNGDFVASDNVSLFADALIGNFNDTNFKIVLHSIEALQLILSRSSSVLTKVYGQRLLSLTIEKFGHVRPNVKSAAYDLLYYLMKNTVLSDFEVSLGIFISSLTHKNASVREMTVQLLSTILLEAERPDTKVLSKVVPVFTQLTKDSAPAVRSQATVALANLSEAYPDLIARLSSGTVDRSTSGLPSAGTGAGAAGASGDKEGRAQGAQKTNASGVRRESSAPNASTRPGTTGSSGPAFASADAVPSLFPPPSTQDPDGQSNPLSIVPPTQQASYYPYRPLYSYFLLFNPGTLVSAVTDFDKKKFCQLLRYEENRMCNEFGSIFTIYSAHLKNEANWMAQLDTVKALISMTILDSEIPLSDNTPIFAQILTDFLCQNLASIVACIVSRRSILSREMCIFIELYAQRYGTYGTRFLVDLVDPLVRLLNQKGACYETSADATLRTIIVYSNPKMALGKLIKHGQLDKSSHVRAHVIEYILLLFLSACLHSDGYLAGKGLCTEVDFWAKHETEIIQLFCKLVDDALPRTRSTAKCALLVMRILRPTFWSKATQLLGSKVPKIEGSARETGLMYYYITEKVHKTRRIPLTSDDFLIEWLRSVSRYPYVKCMDTDFEWKVMLAETVDKFIGWRDVGGVPSALLTDDTGGHDTVVEQPHASVSSSVSVPSSASKHVPHVYQSQRIVRKPFSASSSTVNTTQSASHASHASGQNVGRTSSPVTRLDASSVPRKPQPQHQKAPTFDDLDDLHDLDDLVVCQSSPMSLNQILSKLALHTQSEATLRSLLTKWSKNFCELQPELKESFSQAILVLMDLTKHQSLNVRLEVLGIIRVVLESNSASVEGILDVFLMSMLEVYNDAELAARRAADNVLLCLPKFIPERKLFKGYSSIIGSATGVVLQGSLRLLAKTSLFYQDKALLLEDTEGVFPAIKKAFSNENPDVRRAVVYCLVDLYYQAGEEFTRYLNMLDAAQLKLVVIYVNKMSEKYKQQGQRA